MIKLRAPAKVNLTLEVLAKRDDGYHEIRSLMQAIDLCDVLTFEPAGEITLACSEPELESADNLVLEAARLLRTSTGCRKGARITLQKHIPWAVGLGGGSSDAAATLKGLDQLWRLGVPPQDLSHLAGQVGSDVPFFIHGGTAVVEGRGERVMPLAARPDLWLVLLVPPLPRSAGKTARLYRSLHSHWFTTGEHTRKALALVSQGHPLTSGHLYNVFERAAFGVFSGLDTCWRLLEEASGERPHLAGSGPACFVLCASKELGERVTSILRARRMETFLVRTFFDETLTTPANRE
ncbi:MAG: 4-(cytidine 5'-diphospho)-2-C-methyl-D-erythritol kinase [Chloroflexota bacterium]